MGRRARLAAILLYVTLDLSLPSMPGAFEFDPAESVDGTHSARARLTSEADIAPVPLRGPFATIPSPVTAAPPRAAATRTGPPPEVRGASLPRAPLDPPSTEDPH